MLLRRLGAMATTGLALAATGCPGQVSPGFACHVVSSAAAATIAPLNASPGLPPGIDLTAAYYDIDNADGTTSRVFTHNLAWGFDTGPKAAPIDEAISPSGRYHLWIVAERGAPGSNPDGSVIDTNTTRFLHVYRLDTTMGATTEVERFGAIQLFTLHDPLENARTDGLPNAGALRDVADDGTFSVTVTYDQLVLHVDGTVDPIYPVQVLDSRAIRYANAC